MKTNSANRLLWAIIVIITEGLQEHDGTSFAILSSCQVTGTNLLEWRRIYQLLRNYYTKLKVRLYSVHSQFCLLSSLDARYGGTDMDSGSCPHQAFRLCLYYFHTRFTRGILAFHNIQLSSYINAYHLRY